MWLYCLLYGWINPDVIEAKNVLRQKVLLFEPAPAMCFFCGAWTISVALHTIVLTMDCFGQCATENLLSQLQRPYRMQPEYN